MRSLLRSGLIRTITALQLDRAAIGLRRLRMKRSSPQVLVVEMHETLRRNSADFQRQLEWVAERFTLISPVTFFALWKNPEAAMFWSKPAVLFTFDDGRQSNYAVAAPLLEKFGARGLFFVVPAFIGLSGGQARDFYYSRIDVRGIAAGDDPEEWTPMNLGQLSDLIQRGHVVGNHTLSHTNLASLSTSDLQEQIDGGAAKISSWTGKSVEAFAWPYAATAMTRQSWDVVRAGHQFCFSPCPGLTDCCADSPHLIWRTEIESYYTAAEYRFMYSGLVDPIWAGRRRRLKAMLNGQ